MVGTSDVQEEFDIQIRNQFHSLGQRLEDAGSLVHRVADDQDGLLCMGEKFTDDHSGVPVGDARCLRAGGDQVDRQGVFRTA